jgi:hypothetical protein
MKTLEEYNLIKEFISAQGIQPTAAMLCVAEKEWNDLVYLAKAWERELESEEALEKQRLQALSEEELGMIERANKKQAQREAEKVLFHSCGSDPE